MSLAKGKRLLENDAIASIIAEFGFVRVEIVCEILFLCELLFMRARLGDSRPTAAFSRRKMPTAFYVRGLLGGSFFLSPLQS